MALRDINLVPESTLQRRYLLRHGAGWALAYGLVIAALLGSYLVYTQRTVAKLRVPTSEAQVRKRLVGAIAEIEAKKEEIERLAFVRQVSCSFGTSEILGRLAEIMDPQTWLTEVTLRADEGHAYSLVLKGLASSNAKLGSTIQALTTDTHFEDVVLRDASEVTRAPGASGIREEIVQFSIEAKVLTE